MNLDRLMAEQVRAGFSGVMMVVQNGETTHRRVVASDPTPLAVNSAFYISSVTKSMTALAIAQLAERRSLSFADPIAHYLANVPDDKSDITLHHLLTHTSGLGDHYAAEGITDRDDAAHALLERPLVAAPGTSFNYSNDGYMLLAILMAIVSSQPYETTMRDNLFAPAGMSDSGFWGEKPDHAAPHRAVPDELVEPNWGFRGSTGVYTTVDDLQKWQVALATDLLISAETRRVVFHPHFHRSDRHAYGYGWQVIQLARGDTIYMHAGVDDLLHHNAVLYRTGDGQTAIIVLADCDEDAFIRAHRAVAQVVFT